jgi:hypothetical protein
MGCRVFGVAAHKAQTAWSRKSRVQHISPEFSRESAERANSGCETRLYDTNHDTQLRAINTISPRVIESVVESAGIEPATLSLRTKKLTTADVWFQ